MAIFEMYSVGAGHYSAALAADLWAREAVEVTLHANGSGIKVAGDSDEIPQAVVVPSRFLAGAWYEFCRETGFDSRAVWFSDAQEKEEGFAVLSCRGRNRINRETGTAAA